MARAPEYNAVWVIVAAVAGVPVVGVGVGVGVIVTVGTGVGETVGAGCTGVEPSVVNEIVAPLAVTDVAVIVNAPLWTRTD